MRRSYRLRLDSEGDNQEILFKWASMQAGKYPELELLFHVPNEGKRNYTTAVRMKRQGLKAGVPDLVLPVARGIYHGLFVELKIGKNKTTEKQKEWLERLTKEGYKAVVCYGWEEAKDEILNYLGANKEKQEEWEGYTE